MRKNSHHTRSYDRGFLDGYRPNASFYLSANERAHLRQIGAPETAEQPAGTYARRTVLTLKKW